MSPPPPVVAAVAAAAIAALPVVVVAFGRVGITAQLEVVLLLQLEDESMSS